MVAHSAALSNVPADAPSARKIHRRLWIAFAMPAALAGTNAYLLYSEHLPLTPYGLFVASAILWVCALPLFLFFLDTRRSLGFLPVACALYGVYFAGPAFSPRQLFRLSRVEPEWSSIEIALTAELVAAVALVAGACGLGRVLSRAPRVRREIDIDRALPLLVGASMVGFALRIFTRVATNIEYRMIFITVEDIGLLALGGIMLAWLRGRAQGWHKIYFIAQTFGIAAMGLATGSLAEVAFPMASFVFLYCWERGRLPLGAILAGALLLAPFQVSKSAFRETLRDQSAAAVGAKSLGNRLTNFISITVEMITEGRLEADDVVKANEGRIDMLSTMAIVVLATPQQVPYWGGYTYSDVFWHLIPRAFAPDKPAPEIGQEFPRRYGLIQWFDTETSVNLSQTVELYINFGWFGVGIGMFLIGTLYALLEHALTASTGGAMIGSAIFAGLMNFESNFSIVWGGTPLRLLAFYLFIRMLPLQKSDGPDGLTSSARSA